MNISDASNKGFDNLVGPDGQSTDLADLKTALGKTTLVANQRAMAGKVVDCRFSYGIPVQNAGS